ncbi:MAG TPA: response regulator [Devosiaceae bacterium]|jgi:CheY-like chemotaxis protein
MLQAPYQNLSVLVADNSPHMAELVQTMLRGLGMRKMQAVSDTAAALTLLRVQNFDLLMVEDDLSGLGGIELTRRLRAAENNPNREIAVIMMSALPDAGRIVAARDAGITEFLRKPFSAEHIATRLLSMTQTPRDFITAEGYKGPDRRRRPNGFSGGDRRGRD